MDRHRLIAEVRKRPALWDFSNGKLKYRIPHMWKQVAKVLQADVELCKSKWKNLRDAYRAEVKRREAHIESDIFKGVYTTKADYRSKWAFFEDMSFLNNNINIPRLSIENETINLNSDGHENENYENDSMYDQLHSICDIKLEPQHSMVEDNISLDDNNDYENTSQYDENKYLDTHPTTSTSSKNNLEYNRQNDSPDNNMHFNESQYAAKQPEDVNRLPVKISVKNFSNYKRKHDESESQPTTSKSDNCKKLCQHDDNQMEFLENLEKDEQNLITTTRHDVSHSNQLYNIGDSEFNFLVSFLPQIKKMSDLQNLQFRAKMSELVLNILTSSFTANASPMPPASSENT